MADLIEILERLGLRDYYSAMHENGFETWERVQDISEDDLQQLGFKLGHRRALQREIATFRGLHTSLSLAPEPITGSDTLSALECSCAQRSTARTREGKRKYRRHPQLDSRAPKKPKTAYVNFADYLRIDPAIRSLSFVDIAKEVGRQWQNLSPDSKRKWESKAARAAQEYEVQMDDYKKTTSYRNYKAYLEDFRAQQAREKVGGKESGVRLETPSCLDHHRGSSMSSPGSPVSLASSVSPGINDENCLNSLRTALGKLAPLSGGMLAAGAQPYHARNLPSEAVMRRAMYAFIVGTGSLIYMWSFAQADELLDRLYRPVFEPDPMTTAECFIIAAMGSHYDLEHFSDDVRKALYVSSTFQLEQGVAKVDYLRTMRLLLTLSFHSMLEKHMSARYLISAGLQIGRSQFSRLHSYAHDIQNDSWRRISSVSCVDPIHINEAIRTQASSIGLIAAEVAKIMADPTMITRGNVMALAERLGAWRSQLPLIGEQVECSTYIIYLGALILLYRQSLIAASQVQSSKDSYRCTLDLSLKEIQNYREECVIAARQIARILGLIDFDGTLTKRCWLIIYWFFTACIVPLFSAVSKMLDGTQEGIAEDLTYANGCLETLQDCRGYEPVAERYIQPLLPIYESLRSVHSRTIGRAKPAYFPFYSLQIRRN
ncbi:hypothetical protein BU16DRAFT_620722 [Lophium mytilinum]|uniref:HMG box domain-containing protein n=1 Tax=Lophium mytilinum TaxID=390894 RepID=A0A6A6QIT1_9PEZI|nr:hypothetical protein BU16DRAFT_620722 [Lophium mytilinum]